MLPKILGGRGALQKNPQFITIYKDIILGIKLISPNLFSRIEFCLTCYPIGIGIPNLKPIFD